MRRALVVSLFLSSCSTIPTPQQRAQYVLQQAPPEPARTWIAQGQIGVGMTAEQVIASWGPPGNVSRTVSTDGTHESWIYYGLNAWGMQGQGAGVRLLLTLHDGVVTRFTE